MNDRFLHYLARECRRLAAETETPRRARALVLRARRYLDVAHTAEPSLRPAKDGAAPLRQRPASPR